MPIRYYLRPNPLPGRENQHISQVVSVDSVDEAALIERMATAGGIDRAQVEAVMKTLARVVVEFLGDGHRVNVAGLAHFFPVMTGKFKGADDEFDKKRHRIGVAAAVGQGLVDSVRKRAKLEKQSPADLTPTPTYYKESGDHTVSGKVIPGNIGTIHGRRLAFDPQVADEGIFFVSTAGPRREVRAGVYAVVQPAEIVFQVPAGLGAGSWALEVRARIRGGRQLRKGRLSSPLEAE